jgi:hypothetical protein
MDHELEFGRRVRNGEWNGNATGTPDAPLQGDPSAAWRLEERDARLVKAGLALEQCASHACGRRVEIPIGGVTMCVDDGEARGEPARALIDTLGFDEWNRPR